MCGTTSVARSPVPTACATTTVRTLHILHRDLSPSNITCGYDGAVRLLDFGIAKALADRRDKRTVEEPSAASSATSHPRSSTLARCAARGCRLSRRSTRRCLARSTRSASASREWQRARWPARRRRPLAALRADPDGELLGRMGGTSRLSDDTRHRSSGSSARVMKPEQARARVPPAPAVCPAGQAAPP